MAARLAAADWRRAVGADVVIRPAILAAAFVLVGATDWGLVLPFGEVDCVRAPPAALGTAESLCRIALHDIELGWINGSPRGAYCEPRPGCIPPCEDVIGGCK